MGFQPIVPFSGMAGWAFLKRTQPVQEAAFSASPEMQRETDYFARNIGKVSSAAELVGDYQLLKVALGAFGLDEDLPNKAFIQRVLEEGGRNPESFANRMVDKRYAAFSEAFGFDKAIPNTRFAGFPVDIVEKYENRQFEIAIGNAKSDLRLAMTLERELPAITARSNTPDGKWFAVMGNEPLRQVFETALGLPNTLAMLDLEQQIGIFRESAEAMLGSGEVDQFSQAENREALMRMFLTRSQLDDAAGGMSTGAIALTLLRGSSP